MGTQEVIMSQKINIPNYELVKNAKIFAIKAHADTNHFYDEYLPYQLHLRMVEKAALDHLQIVPELKRAIVLAACWTHDTVEDTRENFNSVLKATCEEVAEITIAVTNYGRGRNRKERMPDFVYEDIKNTPFATFVKLCDRIANIQYSKMTGSDMFKKYKEEHKHFKDMLYVKGDNEELWSTIDTIFSSKEK